MTVATCPDCGAADRTVLETRRLEDRVRRRCRCQQCGARWTTYEINAKHLEQLESAKAPATVAAVQTARLIRLLDFFRDRLIASLPEP